MSTASNKQTLAVANGWTRSRERSVILWALRQLMCLSRVLSG